MHPVICKNNIKNVIDKIQEYLSKGTNIKGIRLVDFSDSQIVLLIDDKPIDQEKANIWWEGYQAALAE